MRSDMPMDARIRSIESMAEMDAFVKQLGRNAPIDSATLSLIALRKIELKLAEKAARK